MSSGHDLFRSPRPGVRRERRCARSRSYDQIIAPNPTHYDVLGVPPDAGADQIRAAYVERARRHHPDVAASADPDAPGGAPTMSEVNLAYQVLRRPESRRAYDRSLSTPQPADTATGLADDTAGSGADDVWGMGDDDRPGSPGARIVGRVLTPPGPAKMPWKLMGAMAIIGTAAVVATAALADPPETEPPDGILQVGSCVTIEPNGDAREVACADDPGLVVRRLLPTGSACPPAYATHRDRLGLGTVCVESAE